MNAQQGKWTRLNERADSVDWENEQILNAAAFAGQFKTYIIKMVNTNFDHRTVGTT